MSTHNSYRRLASLALGVALICSALPASAKTKPDNLVPAGDPVDCIQIVQIRNSDVRDDQTIDFVTNGGKIYRNTLPNSCPSLGFEKRFAYATSLSQLCSVDIITVLQSGGPGLMRGASCGLGKFQPMQKAPK
ncbi:hypothetical protein SAMN02927924_03194 [Sphingobium faniae]|nr:hypothetical protein SAMN02927924_03194 [Sphingobium faniae]